MIYTVLVDILDFCNAYKKRDCHVEWQPLSLIPTEVIEYINLAKSEKAMCERFAAYSSLFISLDKIFEKKNLSLSRTNNGKPYLTEKTEKSPAFTQILYFPTSIASARVMPIMPALAAA